MRTRQTNLIKWLGCASVLLMGGGCASDSGLDVVQDDSPAYGQVDVALSAATAPESRATTSTISPEEAALFLITVYKGAEVNRGPVMLGSMDKRFPAGEGYWLSAESCTEADAETNNNLWGQKRFTGQSAEFAVKKGETTSVTVPMSVANAALCVFVSDNLKNFFTTSCTVQLTEADRSLTWTYDNMGHVVNTETNETTDGQVAYFNIPASGTRTVHYTITAVSPDKTTTSEGDIALEVAKMKRLSLTYNAGFYELDITVDQSDLFYDATITIGPDDVTSDEGETDANGNHSGFETDGTEIDYDTYN